MKAILVIDIKEGADIKALRANLEVYEDIRIKPCYQSCYQFKEGIELKPMPEKKSVELACQKEEAGNDYGAGLIIGWNDCIRELEK